MSSFTYNFQDGGTGRVGNAKSLRTDVLKPLNTLCNTNVDDTFWMTSWYLSKISYMGKKAIYGIQIFKLQKIFRFVCFTFNVRNRSYHGTELLN